MANLPAKRGKKGKIAEPLLEACYWDWLLGGDIKSIAANRGIHYNTAYLFISSDDPKDVAIHDRLKAQYNSYISVERQRQVRHYVATVQDQYMRASLAMGELCVGQIEKLKEDTVKNGGKIPFANKSITKTEAEGLLNSKTSTAAPVIDLKDLIGQWNQMMQPFFRSQQRVNALEQEPPPSA